MEQTTLLANRDVTIRKTTTVDQVVSTLADLVFQGELPPGTPLREEELSSRLGVARTTLREALKELVHKGLVRHHPHRGSTVVALTSDDVADLYRVRRLLEGSAVLRSTDDPRLAERVARLGAIVEEAESAARLGRLADLVNADLAFHRELVTWLESPRTDQYFDSILSELRLGLAQVEREHRSLTAQASAHRRILEALRSSDGDGAARLLEEHLAESEKMVGAAVSSWAVDHGSTDAATTA